MSGAVAAILLAAGKSSRMGSCKQLLPVGGSPAVVRCLDALITGGVGEIAVVVADGGSPVSAAVHGYAAGIVVNPEQEGDMASSVRAGRDGVAEDASGVIVALCDYPLVSAPAISALIAAHHETPAAIIIPCHGERRGHPLLFPRAVLDELTEGKILRDLVRRDPARIRCLDVDDPGVLLDMDTPEDYRRICAMVQAAGTDSDNRGIQHVRTNICS